MTIPSAYTEKTLATYMDTLLGPVADALGWSAPVADAGDYAEAVNEAMLAYGTNDISTITGRDNIQQLRALARVEMWRQVVATTAGHYDFADATVNLKRSQIHEQASDNLNNAEADAFRYGAYGYEATIQNIQHVHDPYAYVEDDDRNLTP